MEKIEIFQISKKVNHPAKIEELINKIMCKDKWVNLCILRASNLYWCAHLCIVSASNEK